MANSMTDWLYPSTNRVEADLVEDNGDPIARLVEITKANRHYIQQNKGDTMAVKKAAREETQQEASKDSETYRVAYMFESNVWGQAMFLEEPKNGMVLITASDFDSGQTVRIGLDIDTFSHLCKTGQTFAAMKSLQGDDGEKDSENSL